MCKFDKNTNYTTTQIAEEIIKVRPYANLHSCRTQVCIYIKREGIKSVNGQVKRGVYCGLDAENIYNHFTSSGRKFIETLKKVEKLPFEEAIDEAIAYETAEYEEKIADIKRFRRAKFFIDNVMSLFYLDTDLRAEFMKCLAEILCNEEA